MGTERQVKATAVLDSTCANPASSLQCTVRPIGRGDLTGPRTWTPVENTCYSNCSDLMRNQQVAAFQ